MHPVHIALQEGFAHDEVLVRLDDATAYQANDLSTRLQIGLAASFDTQAAPGVHALEVHVPTRDGLDHLQTLQIAGETWVGINLRADKLDVRIASTPFGYL